MSILNANFEELYRRHLCRHGQFWLNVNHLVAVLGVYYSLITFVNVVSGSIWTSLVGVTLYTLVLAFNVPFTVLVLNTAVTAGLVTLSRWVPTLPAWCYPILIIAFHKFQLVGHRYYRLSRDMSEFTDKYPKGKKLFILLAVYELPILIRYLFLGRRDWVHTSGDQPPIELAQET